jgi:hypothetical protein
LFSIKNIKFKKILIKDLRKILIWRNNLFIRSKMLNQKRISYSNHLKWFKNLQKLVEDNKMHQNIYNNLTDIY